MTNTAEMGKRSAPRQGWRYAFGVLARSLTVPLILAVGGLTFLLARSLYASSLAVGENLGQVFAFLALFGAIGFFTKLGLSQLNKHLAALLRDLWNYFKSILSRNPASFRESLRALTRRLIPVLVLTIGAGLLSGYIRPPDAEPEIPSAESAMPRAIEVHSGESDVTVSFRGANGQNVSTNIVGLRGVIAKIVTQSLEDQAGPKEPAVMADQPVMIEPIRSNYVASFPILFERASLDPGPRSAAAAGGGAEFAGGAAYDAKLNRKFIRLLVESLDPCGEEDGTRPVWLSVRGHASSAPFRDGRGEALPLSGDLNVRLANTRRRSVEGELRKAIGEADAERRIRLTPEIDYTLPSQLRRDRKFNDRPGAYAAAAGSLPQDVLTRVAYVNILSAANCAPD